MLSVMDYDYSYSDSSESFTKNIVCLRPKRSLSEMKTTPDSSEELIWEESASITSALSFNCFAADEYVFVTLTFSNFPDEFIERRLLRRLPEETMC